MTAAHMTTGFVGAWRDGRADKAAAVRDRTRNRTPVLVAIGRTLGRAIPHWQAIRTVTLSLAGFGLLTDAAWEVNRIAGLAAAGLSLLVLEMLTGETRR